MRYTPTRARREFDTWIIDALVLVRAARKQATHSRVVADGILCAGIFLTHARFENYFRDIVSFAIEKINGENLLSKSLPGRLRAAHLTALIPHAHLKHYYIHGNERLFLDRLHNVIAESDWSWSFANYNGKVEPSIVIGQKGYPSVENLKSVFHKLGIDIVPECNHRLRTDVAAMIDDISGLRGVMAHLGMPTGLTSNDVEDKIGNLKKIVRVIDRIVHEKFMRGKKRRKAELILSSRR